LPAPDVWETEALDGLTAHGIPVATFDHTAIAVPSIRTAIRPYLDVLGGEVIFGGDNPAMGYRAVVLKFNGGSHLELLEPRAGGDLVTRFLARSPRGGLHHITFSVDDVAASLAAVAAAGGRTFGAELVGPPPRPMYFIHPHDADGALIQVYARVTRPLRSASLAETLAGHGRHGNGVASP
jgi:methylmalonyl-CoA/ethylmalonyl-CoA epimerase